MADQTTDNRVADNEDEAGYLILQNLSLGGALIEDGEDFERIIKFILDVMEREGVEITEDAAAARQRVIMDSVELHAKMVIEVLKGASVAFHYPNGTVVLVMSP